MWRGCESHVIAASIEIGVTARTVAIIGGAVGGGLFGGLAGQILVVNVFGVSYEASLIRLVRDELPAALTVSVAVIVGSLLGALLVRAILVRTRDEQEADRPPS